MIEPYDFFQIFSAYVRFIEEEHTKISKRLKYFEGVVSTLNSAMGGGKMWFTPAKVDVRYTCDLLLMHVTVRYIMSKTQSVTSTRVAAEELPNDISEDV